MTGSWFAQQAVGALIAAVIFTAIGSALVWWKARPFWRKHKTAIMAAIYRGTND